MAILSEKYVIWLKVPQFGALNYQLTYVVDDYVEDDYVD